MTVRIFPLKIFSIQKFILQIFAIINGTSVMNSGKNLQYDFPKMRGRSKAVWNFSENSSVLVGPSVPKAGRLEG